MTTGCLDATVRVAHCGRASQSRPAAIHSARQGRWCLAARAHHDFALFADMPGDFGAGPTGALKQPQYASRVRKRLSQTSFIIYSEKRITAALRTGDSARTGRREECYATREEALRRALARTLTGTPTRAMPSHAAHPMPTLPSNGTAAPP